MIRQRQERTIMHQARLRWMAEIQNVFAVNLLLLYLQFTFYIWIG